jgi:predicted transcriptional regulator
MPETPDRLLTLTAQIAAAYVGAHAVEPTVVPGLIRSIHGSLTDLDPPGVGNPAKPGRSAEPAVAISKSVFVDHLICLEDGQKMKTLKRHLMTAHNLTPNQYRTKWGLPATYPMVAEEYTKIRSRLATEFRLGQSRRRKKAPTS